VTRLVGAKCVGRTDEMFPRHYHGPKADAARAICEGCPAIEPCANAAIGRREQFGVWGGLTPDRIDIIAKSRAGMLREVRR
jgi:hypothetical protein